MRPIGEGPKFALPVFMQTASEVWKKLKLAKSLYSKKTEISPNKIF